MVAVGLANGLGPVEAVRNAGYSDNVADHCAARVVNSSRVREALAAIGATITPEHLGNLSKARLAEKLADPDISTRELGVYIHEGLTAGRVIGPAAEIHHRHTLEIPEAARELIAHRIVEITAKRAELEAHTVDMEEGDGVPGIQQAES
jgi:hypothetical protein